MWICVVAVVGAVALVVPHPGPRRLLARLGSPRVSARRTVGSTVLAVATIGTVAVVALVGWGAGASAVTTSACLVAVTAGASVRSVLAARAVRRRSVEVARACDLIGSLVAVGHIPAMAVRIAADETPVLAPVAAAQRVGSDVAAALRAAGSLPGSQGLVRLAQAWEVGERTGAPLGTALAAVADAVRRDHEVGHVVMAELAGPKASGQVLAVLPIVGLATGFAMGGEPLEFFTTGIIGPACLVLGTALACLGVAWTERLVARATPASPRSAKMTVGNPT